MKTPRKIGLIVLLLLLVTAGALGVLLGTPSGLRFLVERVDDALPGTLDIAGIEGGLFGELQLEQVSYRDEAVEVGADEVRLRWRPRALLQGRFHLLELSVITPRFTQRAVGEAPPPEDPDDEGLTLPDLALPIEIHVDRVAILDFRFQAAPRQPLVG